MRRITGLHLVVPVHNEEELLADCLSAIEDAVAALRRRTEAIEVDVTVVLDACSDASAEIAARFGARCVRIDVRSVGRARAAGIADVARRAGRAAETWIATTDADSRVPASWLTAQLDLARDGVDLMVGRVRPDRSDLAHDVVARWWHHHRALDGVAIHGANLGFTLAVYERAGGFAAVTEHEDVMFVQAAVRTGCRWTQTGPWVRTSGRTRSRVVHGFAGYLRALVAEAGCA